MIMKSLKCESCWRENLEVVETLSTLNRRAKLLITLYDFNFDLFRFSENPDHVSFPSGNYCQRYGKKCEA